MTNQRPRRRRRLNAPAASPPRPTTGEAHQEKAHRQHVPQLRAHHVTKDYAYVRRDLLGILAAGLISLGFIGFMSFLVR